MKHKIGLILFCVLFAFTANAQIKKQTIVIVHVAWGGGWAFKKVDSLLTEKGLNVYRPTLTGQGERAQWSAAFDLFTSAVK